MMLIWDEAKNKLGLRWGNELLKLFPKGLQPYSCKDEGVVKIICPHKYHAHALKLAEWRRIRRKMEMLEAQENRNIAEMDRLENIENRIMQEAKVISSKDPNLFSWEFYVHPETNEGVKDVLNYLKKEGEVCFRPEDVEKIKSRIIEDALIIGARKEIQKVYEYIKQNIDSKFPLIRTEKKDLKKYALEAFRKYGKDFKYLKRDHLGDMEVYKFSSRPNREFIGRLLSKCFQDRELKYSGGAAQKLFERSQELRREKEQ